METYNKKYKIVAPDGYVEEWSQADFEKGGAALMSDNPDVKVYSQESYDPSQQYGTNVAYGIEDEDGYFESWTADEWSKGKDALLKDHPNLKIYVLGDASQDYHRQKAEEQRQAITDFDAANKDFIRAHELDSLIMSEGGAVSADYDANDKKYNDLIAEREQLVSNYATNPANKQDWSASAQYADQIASNYESKLKGMRDATRFSNAATSMYSGNIRENNDYMLYEQARKLAKDAAKAYAAPSYGEHTGFGGYVRDMGTGAGKVFSDVDFWSRGLSAIDRDKNVRKIVNSLSEKGINVLEATEKELYDNLSPAQIALISSFLLDAQAQYERSLDTARGYNAGVTFAESIGYMAEFLATGGIARAVGSAGKAASSGFGKLLANELSKGSEAAIKSKVSRGLINTFTKGGTKSLSKSAKAATNIASKAAGKAYSYGIRPAESAIWHTALQPSTYRTISENLTQINDNGDLVKAGSAIWGGVLDQLIENWSESMGGAVEDILGLPLKGVGATGEKILGKTTLGQWGKWLADSASAKVLHEAGFNGLIGEMGEEWLGNAARVGLGLMTKDEFKDFASFESQVDMAASFAPMTLFGLGTSSYAAAKQDKNYRKLAKDMRGVLNRAGWSEEDVADVMDVKHTKEEIARTLAPVLQSIVRNSQDGKVAQEDYITTLKFAQAAAIQEVLSSAQTIEQERARKEMQEEIAQNLGAVPQEFKNEDGTTVIYPTDNRGNFSYTQVEQTPSGNYGVNVVTTAKDAKGEYFVIPDDDSDTMLLKNRNDANATPRFISRQEFQEQVDAGLMTTETSTLDNYLDARIEEKREMQRKYAENAQLEDKYQQVAQKMQVGSKINAGTEDAPMEGVVLAVDRGGVTVDFGQPVLLNGRNMQIHKLSLEQAGNFVGIDARIESEQRSVEEQVEQDEINSAKVKAYNQSLAGEQFTVDGHLYTYVHMFEMPQLDDDGTEIAHIVATDEQGRDVEMDIPLEDIKTRETDAAVKTNEQVEEVKDDNVLRDIHGNPIPMRVNEKTQQQEVDKRTFKNKDPEAYYAWNDAQRGGNTEDSMQAITADIASETAQLTALQKRLTVETDPDMRDELHESVNKTQNRINLLEGIYHKYDAENNFQDEQLDFARRIYDVQSKLINAKTQEQVDALIKIKADLFRQYQLATVDSAENVMLAKRAVELQQVINSVADVPVQVVFESNIEAVMRTDGASEASINRVLSKVAELRSARITSGKDLVMTGLYNEGKVYIFAEGNTDASSALLTYYHERQHMRTAEDPEAMNKVLVLARNERDNLMQVLSLLTDNIAPYQGASNQELADEIVASAMEKACTDEEYEQTLRSRGLSEELINIIKTEYAKQRRITDSDAVRQEDWNANVRTSDTGNGQQDGAVEQGASGNGQLGTAQLSTDTGVSEEEPQVDTTPRDFRGNPLPLEADGTTVDQKTLWENDPEAWARWNDDINNDAGADSIAYINAVIEKLNKAIKTNEKAYAKATDFDKRDTLKGQIKEEKQRLDELLAILRAYRQKQSEEASAKMQADAVRAREARKAKAEELAKYNTESLQDIKRKWEDAPKDTGDVDSIVLANGERIEGHYVLTEAFAPTPSHDPVAGYSMTKGFPVDENGNTVNDRDYQHDKEAQRLVEQKASSFDQRALQTPVVVSSDGVVLSGNDRTMASQIAARQGTDNNYNTYLASHPQRFGFTADQISNYSNPRVVFVPDSPMPYTAATFAKFNAEEKKTQSKTESAVKAGKTISPEAVEHIAMIVNEHESIAETYSDKNAVSAILRILIDSGVVQESEISRLMDGDSLSGTGEDLVESVILGAVMREDALRCAMGDKMIRRSVMSALTQLLKNNTYGEYSLSGEFSDAVVLLYQAKRSGLVEPGESVANFMNQPVLDGFGENPLAEVTVQMLANTINGTKVNGLKNVLSLYNARAEMAASGQADLFLGSVEAKEQIIREILNEYGYNTETFTAAAAEQRPGQQSEQQSKQGSSEEQAPNAVSGDAGSGAEEINQVRAIEEQRKVVDTEPTEAQKEAGNYRMGHVRIDGLDITIESPRGSIRKGTDADGHEWQTEMHNDYGYIRGTKAVDDDHIDVFLSDNPTRGKVYVIDQVDPKTGEFDESKVMYGFDSEQDAREAYLSNYEDGWQGLGKITEVSKEEFKKWIDSSTRKTKPFSEYKSVKFESLESPKTGAFGTIYIQFKGKPQEAIAFLLEKKEGEAVGALHHKDIGDIDLVWGKEGTAKSDGFGLAKLAKYHPEVLGNLQEILDAMVVVERTDNRVQLESKTHQASVRLTWDSEKKNWLLTAFEKKNSVSDNTTDTVGTAESGKRNDTATPQNTVSDGKSTQSSETKQENGELSDVATEIFNDTLSSIPEEVRARVTVRESSTGDEVKENFIQSYDLDGKPSGIFRLELFDIGINKNPTRFVIDGSAVDSPKQEQERWQQLADEYKQLNPEVKIRDWEESGINFRTFKEALDFLSWAESFDKENDAVSSQSSYKKNEPLNKAEDSRFRIVESTDEEILSDSNQKDSEYFAAIERGDMEEAQRIVNEFAQKAGYTTISDYQGTSAFNGAAPYGNPYFFTKEERKDAWDNDEFEGDQTLGDYIERGIDAHNLDFIALDPRNYRAANSMRKEAIDNVRNAIQKRSKTITMFRSVPSEIKEGSFRNGDWVTPSRAYAVDNAKIHGWGDNYNIIKQTVSVDEIWWDGNDIAEWGYGREEDYVKDTDFAYKNTKNNRKLLDVITRDDKGNIIPPSRRFDSGNADERYHISGRKAIDKSSEESRIAYEAVKEQLDRIGIPVELLSDQAMREMAINANALETVSSQDEYQQTVVSSASGTKVINNLDNLAKSLENEPKTKEKTFLGALAKALDAKKHGSNSQYATFEAKNGTVVTIRLANHNVTTSTFDNHGENDGISIVVSARKNNGIINDGKAHVTEFYYDAIKLRKAEGKPLVDIVKSVKQSLYSGEYKDTTGLAQREEVNAKDVPEFMTVYHGSGAKFDKFDHSHMGEGEGVQAYGWGTYVTEVEGIGRTYAKAMAAKDDGALPKRNLYTVEIPEDINSALSKDEILKGLDSLGKELFSGYGLNDVQINAVFGTTREWYKLGYTATSGFFPLKEAFKAYGIDAETIDKRIHDEAMEDRQKNPAGYGFYLNWAGRIDMWIEKLGISEDEYERYDMATGRDAYRYLESKLGGAKEASDYLSDHGYVGISYPAQYRSGGRSDGARNYVIFNENNAKIVDRIEFLREPDGTVYGATVGGKIYLNRERLNPNTPIHEYTHLWFSALKDANLELYKRGVELMKQLPIWEEVRTDPNYANLSGDDAIASECLSRLVGDKGADVLTKMAKDANVRGDIIGTANRISLIEKFKDWLKKFWTWVRDSFAPWTKEEAARVSVDDIQNMVLSDLAKGVNPLANAREESEMKKTDDKYNDDDFEYLIKRNPGSFDAPENGIRFRIVTEPKLIEQLNLEPTEKVFRAMQIVDGELFPPMSITVNGKKREPSKIGQWEQSEENPELADEDGYFKLNKGKNDKGENKSLKAKYNPYFHTSLFPLNDQFSEAQTRSNIVIVEGRVPKSELTSGYRAEKAKDPVGKMTWHSGPVAGILGQYEGKEREVILSRWFKPERIVPYDQIADISVQMFKGTSLEKNPLPSNVFHPDLRNELEKRGVSFVETNNRGQLLDDAEGRTWSSLYGKEAAGKKVVKTLAGVHNITEEKLRKALKLGGFANPSLAVIDTEKSNHENFGEISLIAPSDLVNKESGRTAGTWTTDAYTQRYPSVERQMSDKGYEEFSKWVDGLDFTDSEKDEIKRQTTDALEVNREPAWELMYLKEKGIDIKAYSSDVSYGWELVAETYGSVDDVLNAMEGDAELDEKIRNLVKVEIASPLMSTIINTIRLQIYEETGKVPSSFNLAVPKRAHEIFDKEYAPKLFDENGQVKSEDVRKVVEEMLAKYNDTKRFNFQKAKARASIYVHNNGMYTDYLRWEEEKLEDYGTKGRIFRGYNSDGTRRYSQETLENVSKAMSENAEGETNGSESTSFGSFIAKLAPHVDSTEEMRRKKDKLSSAEDEKKEFYDKWEDTYYALAKELYDDVYYGEKRLHEIVLQQDPKRYAKKEYGITLSASFMKNLEALKKAIREDLKSPYFETMFERPVGLNEFAAAVVPNDLGADVRKMLDESGIALYEYDPAKEGDRSRAFNEALDGNDKIRFRIVGGNSGYVGYSMSKRAAEAKEEGRFPKTQFVKEYGVPATHLDALVAAGIISNDEWHHTSKFGNKTPFYGWVEDSFLQAYNDNKAAIEDIIEQYNGTDPLSFTERRKLAEKIAAIIESSESVVSAREPAEALIAQREAEKAHRRDVMSEMANSDGKIKKAGNEYWYSADNQVSLHMRDNGRIIDIEFPIGTKTQSQRDELYKAAQEEFREAYERAEKILQDKANENSEEQKLAPDVESSESRFTVVKSYDGLQSFGQDKLFDIMHKTFADLPESTRTKITKLAPAHGYKFHEATADYFASLATKKDLSEEEKMDVMVVRDNIKAALDIDYLSCSEALWALYNTVNKNSKDILSIARRTLVADKLGFMPEDRSKRDDVKDGVRFSIRENSHGASAAEIYNKATSYWYNRLRESYVDMNESVNDLVAAIESTTKQPAQAFEDVRLAINRQSSKGLNQMTKFMSDYLEPMWGAVGKVMEATGMTYDEVVRYVMLKHAVERNDVFARRDARRFYERKCDSIISKLNDEKKQKENMRKRAMANAEISIAYALDQEIQNIDKRIDSALKALDHQLVKVDNGTSTKYKELREQDYGGLTSMYSKYPGLGARSDYATDEEYNKAARKVRVPMYDNVSDMEIAGRSEVNAFENRTSGDEFNELWRRINAATKKTLESQYDNNIISREQYNAARDQFKYYVPLRGFKDTEAEDIWTYMDVSLSGSFAPALKNAKGRKSEAENPFNWIGTMASSAIAQNVKNEAKLALYYFIANRPNQDLVTIGKVWYQYDAAATAAHAAANPGDTRKIFTPVYPPVTTGLDSNAAKDAYDTWEADMRAKAAAGEAYLRTNKLNVQDDVAFISDKQVPQHVIKLKVRGEEVNLYINGDPRAAQAINGMLNVETNSGYHKVFGPILRWMSAVNTSYNPEFWISNLQRDFLFALMSSSITGEGANNLLKGFVNPKKIMQMMRDYEAGKLGNSREENYYREFAEGGGITGFTVIVGNEVWEKKIQEYLNPSDFAKISKSIKFDKFLKFFNDLGEAVEQMSRFAAFISARETGKSIEEAVAASKEITVNFNRKGSGKAVDWADLDKLTTADGAKLNKAQKLAVFTASFIPAYGRRFIMFFNAAVQGANAMYKLWKKDHRKTLAWASGYFAIGVLQAVLHALADDDDDYLDIPDYTRRSNLLLGGGGIYFKWALPQEMRQFYAWGDIFVNQVMGREPNKNMLLEMANSAADILPLGPGGVLPSVIQPSWDLYTNKDFTGSRIYNDNKYLSDAEREARPNYKDPRPQTNKLFIDISQVLNALSGGDEYSAGAVNVHPESMQHVVESLGGGLLTTMNKTEETVAGALGAIIGEDMIDCTFLI